MDLNRSQNGLDNQLSLSHYQPLSSMKLTITAQRLYSLQVLRDFIYSGPLTY